MNLVDAAFDCLGKNVTSLALPQLSEAVQLMDQLDIRSVQFMSGAAKYMLSAFNENNELSEADVEILSVAFYTFSKHDVP
jgi:hypothetical protein